MNTWCECMVSIFDLIRHKNCSLQDSIIDVILSTGRYA